MAEHICPVWVGHLLASPVRKLLQNPRRILTPYVTEGMTVLDVGSAMGFFSLPLARMVGERGRVLCVDLQEKMLIALRKRAGKAALLGRIETRTCSQNSLQLDDVKERIDFVLACAVVHEVPEPKKFFSEIYAALKQSAKFLIFEPKSHVSKRGFEASIELAEKAGFRSIETPHIARSYSVVCEK